MSKNNQSEPVENQELRRIYSAEERTALTCGRLSGRSSLAQQSFLESLGVPRSTSVRWTKYHASKEIAKRTAARHTPSNRLQKVWNQRLQQAGLGVIRPHDASQSPPATPARQH